MPHKLFRSDLQTLLHIVYLEDQLGLSLARMLYEMPTLKATIRSHKFMHPWHRTDPKRRPSATENLGQTTVWETSTITLQAEHQSLHEKRPPTSVVSYILQKSHPHVRRGSAVEHVAHARSKHLNGRTGEDDKCFAVERRSVRVCACVRDGKEMGGGLEVCILELAIAGFGPPLTCGWRRKRPQAHCGGNARRAAC